MPQQLHRCFGREGLVGQSSAVSREGASGVMGSLIRTDGSRSGKGSGLEREIEAGRCGATPHCPGVRGMRRHNSGIRAHPMRNAFDTGLEAEKRAATGGPNQLAASGGRIGLGPDDSGTSTGFRRAPQWMQRFRQAGVVRLQFLHTTCGIGCRLFPFFIILSPGTILFHSFRIW